MPLGLHIKFLLSPLSSVRCAEGDVIDSTQVNLVHHLDHGTGWRLLVGEQQNAGVGVYGAHAFDVGAHRAHVNDAAVDPDLAIVKHLDLNALGVGFFCSKLVGRFTLSPYSFTNTAVMMKKIRRLITKSSIGARSMP
jgi:hypothetical protein